MRLTFPISLIAILALTTAISAADPQLHPLQSYTAIYSQEGMMSGAYEEYCRNYCYERVEVENFSVNMAGMVIPGENRRILAIGATKYTIDFSKGTVTEFINPWYADMVTRSEQEGPIGAAKAYLAAAGTVETSETAVISGISCTIWLNPQAGSRLCMSEEMINVQTEINIAGMAFIRTLVEFIPNDPGADELYEIPDDMSVQQFQVPAGAPANLGAILEMLTPAAQ